MTENILFLHPNEIDSATLSGGSWESAAPLTEIQDRILGRRARSTSLSTTATTVDIDLDRAVEVKGVAVVGHNIRTESNWRVEGFSDSGRTSQVYDSGFVKAWQSPDDVNRDWDDPDYPTGRPRSGDLVDISWPLVHPITAGQSAKYWTVTFDDPSNGNGFLEIGRIVIAYGWQAPINFTSGASEGWQDDSEVVQAFSGTEFFREKIAFRRFSGSIEMLDKDPAFGRVHELLRRAKKTREIMVIPEPDDSTHINRRSFLARMTDLSTLERQAPDFSNASFNLKEIR